MNGPMVLRSSLLAGIAGTMHCFTTRQGPAVVGQGAGFDLSTRSDTPRDVVAANRQRILEELGCPQATFVTLKQVHGDAVVEVTRRASGLIEADGMWTRDPQAALAVLVADCVPILIAHVSGRAVAAVHAGWRGTAQRVAARMVERLAGAGLAPEELRAALGPAIGPCCFEIREEVAQGLAEAFPEPGEALLDHPGGTYRADLWQLNERTLLEAGLTATSIETIRRCTVCSGEFFSHRGNEGAAARQAGIIALA